MLRNKIDYLYLTSMETSRISLLENSLTCDECWWMEKSVFLLIEPNCVNCIDSTQLVLSAKNNRTIHIVRISLQKYTPTETCFPFPILCAFNYWYCLQRILAYKVKAIVTIAKLLIAKSTLYPDRFSNETWCRDNF